MEIEKIITDLKEINFTAFDVELANPKKSSICSIGIVEVKQGEIIYKEEMLIRPKELTFSEVNKKIHRISEKDVEKAIEFDEAWHRINKYFIDSILIAHNAIFDIDAIKQTSSLYNVKLPELNYICSLKLAVQIFKDLTNFRLDDVAGYLNINHQHHNSLSDATICAEIGKIAFPKIDRKLYTYWKEDLSSNFEIKSSLDKKKFDYGYSNKINKELLVPNLELANQNHIFYNKKIVFTGTLKNYSDRNKAGEIVQKYGGDINTSISKKTDIVIMGEGAGPKKIETINMLKEQGIDIRIIFEEEFISIIENSKFC